MTELHLPDSDAYDVWEAIRRHHDDRPPDQRLLPGDRVLVILDGLTRLATVLRDADSFDMALIKMDNEPNHRRVWRARMRRLDILEQLADIAGGISAQTP